MVVQAPVRSPRTRMWPKEVDSVDSQKKNVYGVNVLQGRQF